MKFGSISNNMYKISPDMIDKNEMHPLLSSFFLISVGTMNEQHTKGKYVDRFFEREYLMLYCIDGQGWTETPNGKLIKINPGDVLFCFEKTYQKYWADKYNPWTIAWARFNGTDVRLLLDNINITYENPVLSLGFHEKVLLLIKEMINVMEKGFAFNHILHASNCLRTIFSNFTIHHTINSEEPAISRINDYMKININQEFHLNQIANIFGVTNDYLIRYFKKQTGYTPKEYFINLKIQKACFLIVTTDKSICDISKELGFKDAYYFSRIFKKKTSYSPSEYRKTHVFM